MSKTAWMFIIAAVIAIGGYLGYQHWRDAQAALPFAIASGDGRIEAKLVDITPKEALRVKEILVDEGDLVKPGQVVVRMDTATLDAQLAEAKLNVVAKKQEEAVTRATITKREAEIDLAKTEVKRSTALVRERAGSQRELDVRPHGSQGDDGGARGGAGQAAHDRGGGQGRGGHRCDDPDPHRRRHAQISCHGEGALSVGRARRGRGGGRESADAHQSQRRLHGNIPALRAGCEDQERRRAELTIDALPGVAVAGYVSFVSPEAQFTPKQVGPRASAKN